MPIVDRLSDLIGNTPTLRLSHLAPAGVELFAKAEFLNPGGSIKDRPIREILDAAAARGELQPGGVLLEATSGNTGISLAMLCAERGYSCVLVMPEDMSMERRRILRAYGARVELTARELGMAGAAGAGARAAGGAVVRCEPVGGAAGGAEGAGGNADSDVPVRQRRAVFGLAQARSVDATRSPAPEPTRIVPAAAGAQREAPRPASGLGRKRPTFAIGDPVPAFDAGSRPRNVSKNFPPI